MGQADGAAGKIFLSEKPRKGVWPTWAKHSGEEGLKSGKIGSPIENKKMQGKDAKSRAREEKQSENGNTKENIKVNIK